MRIFLTGATGYIGGALARRLAADGHELRCLARPTSDTTELEAIGAATFEGDVTDRYSMRRGMSGADWVVHAAAVIDLGSDPRAMAEVNVGGSENVASLAAKLGVPRFLSVASMAVWGGSPDDGSAATEATPPNDPPPTAYSATKAAGERAIRAWEEKGLLEVHTVFPGLVYGPPGKRSGANAMLRTIAKGRLPALVGADRWVSWIHVDDLVDGMLRMIKRAQSGGSHSGAAQTGSFRPGEAPPGTAPPEPGSPKTPEPPPSGPGISAPGTPDTGASDSKEALLAAARPKTAASGPGYLMTGDSVRLGELVERVCEIAGARPPRLTLPLPVAKLAAMVLPPIYRLRGWRPPLGTAEVRSLERHWRFDDAKARAELGWRPRDLAEGLPPAVEYLLAGDPAPGR